MNGIFWILVGGISGWLTGKLVGEKGYGKVLGEGYATAILGSITLVGVVRQASARYSPSSWR